MHSRNVSLSHVQLKTSGTQDRIVSPLSAGSYLCCSVTRIAPVEKPTLGPASHDVVSYDAAPDVISFRRTLPSVVGSSLSRTDHASNSARSLRFRSSARRRCSHRLRSRAPRYLFTPSRRRG